MLLVVLVVTRVIVVALTTLRCAARVEEILVALLSIGVLPV